jgi:hypothetical protein
LLVHKELSPKDKSTVALTAENTIEFTKRPFCFRRAIQDKGSDNIISLPTKALRQVQLQN